MFKKRYLILTLLFSNLVLAKSGIEASYKFKNIFDLKKYGQEFVEVPNSRAVVGRLEISLNHGDDQNKKENFSVKINSNDLNDNSKLRINSAHKKVSFGKETIKLSNKYSANETKDLFGASLRRDVLEMLKKIDPNISKSNASIDLSFERFNCQNINSTNKECLLEGSAVVVVNKNSISKVDVLKEQLLELKNEMKKSDFDYDIIGYRDFLSKCEELVKDILTEKSKSKENDRYVEVRRKLINERVDSYEYTAIRAKTIVTFLDDVLALI